MTLREIIRDWRIAGLLHRRTVKRDDELLLKRRRDGTHWVAGCPQNFGYAMGSLFSRRRCDDFHFYRVREWQGLLLASPKVFWRPQLGEFEIGFRVTVFRLPRWPEEIECAKIDRMECRGT
jgi:hypothetical protein